MRKTWKSLVCILVAGLMVATGPVVSAQAVTVTGEKSFGGISEALSKYYESLDDSEEENAASLFSVTYNIPDNIAIANVSSILNIRKGPGTKYSRVGILSKNGACLVESIDANGWAKITSGEVSGYVDSSYLIMGEEAKEIAAKSVTLYAIVNSKVSALNVRKEPSTSSKRIAKVSAGDKLYVSKEVVVNKEDENAKVWVEIYVNDDENVRQVAYVSSDYVTLAYDLDWAVNYTPYGPDVSDLRVSICDEAATWIGWKYVWGGNGNKPSNGIDCSRLVQKVFAEFGYDVPRTSREQASYCTQITKDELKPGDLVFYGTLKPKYINHVAIYIGNGKIIHSSTNYKGVAISSMYFYSSPDSYGILKYGRIVND